MIQSIPKDAEQEPVWHNISADDAIEKLNSHRMLGLSSTEVDSRLKTHGYNELTEAPRPTFWKRLWDQINDFLIWLLIVASIISLVIGDYIEAAAILAIVVLNSILGVIQESRAEEALAALKKMSAPEAQVIRDGVQQNIPTRELIPGDLVILETGNYVPADVRLIEAINLQVNEASLTGESVPVQKRADTVFDRELPLGDRKNTAYMSTVVSYGRGRGVVVSTGMHTQIGLIAQMVQSFENEPTPLQRKLDQLGKVLGISALAICGVVFLINIIRLLINPSPDSSIYESILEMFMVAVSLAIAAVPEGLPAVVTICLALGMQRMVQRHALLRQLSAVEALGSSTIICSDKTGTLTQNAMTVVKIWSDDKFFEVTGDGYDPEGAILLGGSDVDLSENQTVKTFLQSILLCNDAYIETSGTSTDRLTWRMVGDPTEGALVVVAAKAGLWRYDLENLIPRKAEIPFDSERKTMTTIHQVAGNTIGFNFPRTKFIAMTKGAPDIILSKCNFRMREGEVVRLTDQDRKNILDVNSDFASQALRVLGAAVRFFDQLPGDEDLKPDIIENDLIFTGLVGMIDPPRPEVKPAIEKAKLAGIRSVMITGDYPDTAIAIAQQIGLYRPNSKVVTGKELDLLSDETFINVVDDVDVYARVSPQHKVKIVEALQNRRHVVSMTGDGVNDAPALKKADIGVAMGIMGTDVSKEAAAMVLTDDNYASIVSAIEEGRIIYSNIRKFVFYLLSCNVGEILIVFLVSLVGWPLPLTPLSLLVLNLITDGAPALALGLEKGDPDIMKHPPRQPDEPVINRSMVWGIVIQGLVITLAVLGAFRISLYLNPDNLQHAQTVAFATLSIGELFRAYTSRSETYSIFKLGIFSNKYMQYAVLSSLVILLAIIYLPFLDPIFQTTFLTVKDWIYMIPLILLPSVAAELTKWAMRRRMSR
jgi:P-type Ca2+ transporter type 2C